MNRRDAQRLLGRASLPGHQRLVLRAYLRSAPQASEVETAEVVLGRTELRRLTGLTWSSITAAREALLTHGLLEQVATASSGQPVCRVRPDALAAWVTP